MPEMVG